MEIGQKLKDKRTGSGLSQEQLAEKIGVTRQTIANWEKGKTYPDIVSVLKLSDLYDVSLDELVKEDASMRKHVEESAVLPRKYWNILFEVAILLLPFGLLVGHWGFPVVGFVIQIIGLGMLPLLWVVQHKLFGTSKEDMRNSLIGWGLYVGAEILWSVGGDNLGIALVVIIMSLIGLLMVYRHGVHLERSTRFWLVIALYIGIPAFIMGSGLMGLLAEQGTFGKTQPFGHNYRIIQADVGAPDNPNTVIHLRSFPPALELDGEQIGLFEYIAPANYQQNTTRGIWHLVPEDDPNGLYKLEVNMDNKTSLSYFIDDQLQWRWELGQIPKALFFLNNSESLTSTEMDWFSTGTYTGNPTTVNSATHSGEGTAFIQCNAANVTELTVKEEYHHGDEIEYREYILQQDKNGNFPLQEAPKKRYEGDDQYILYRIQWEGGEYLLCLNLS